MALGLAAPGSAAPNAADPLWNRQCAKGDDGRELCYVEQYAIAMPDRAVLLNIRIGFLGPQGQARVLVTVPLGTPLMPGLTLTIDTAKPITVPFESCQPGGCRVVADLDPGSLDQIRRGTRMTVRYAAGDGKPLDIPVTLTGLDAALKQLKP